ncbi:MAG: hypothetical protein AB1772_00625 [Candidatus Zixiibacteriota bacterium]
MFPDDCPCIGKVGNVNCDYRDEVSIADATYLIDHLFITGIRLPNKDEANVDGDSLGSIDIADVTLLIEHLFITLPELPLCPKPPNHPPTTRIVGFIDGLPFINSVALLSPITGVRMRWQGADRIDFPTDPPPFEFEWRLYGPYDSVLFSQIADTYIVPVLRRDDGSLLRTGDSVCDTSWTGGVRLINCYSINLDTMAAYNKYGEVKWIIDVDNPGFSDNLQLNTLAARSSDQSELWTSRERDSIYDVFADFPADTTSNMQFIFWVRSRESLDTVSVDPTPDWRSFHVIDPKFERDVLVMSFWQAGYSLSAYRDSTKSFWNDALDTWISSRGQGSGIVFDTARDYMPAPDADRIRLLEQALRHKVLILTQDAAGSAGLYNGGMLQEAIWPAIDLGVNAWVCARVPVGYFRVEDYPAWSVEPSGAYGFFFGVVSTEFPGWGYGIFRTDDGNGYGLPRREDFVGAVSQNDQLWPELSVDTSLLRSRYRWSGSIDPPVYPYYPFIDTIGALPQVGCAEPVPEAEVMYLYRSLYGVDSVRAPYANKPVMHRLERDYSRTVHSMFTPLSITITAAQQLVSIVLDWLYDGFHNRLAHESAPGCPVESVHEGGQR